MQEAIVLPLEFWQDPVGDVILLYSDRQCSVYFGCWDENREPAEFIGHLAFEHASDVRSAWRDYSPYRIPDHPYHSYILEIPDSDFVRQYVTYRNRRTPEAPIRMSDRHHYVVMGHEIYHEIVAVGFTASTIPNDQVTDAVLRALIDAV